MAKYNKATMAALCEYLENGMNKKDAAAMVGIGETTLYRWMKENGSFGSRVEASVLTYKQKLIQTMNISAVDDGRLALEILARRWPGDFGKNIKVETFDPHEEYKRMMARINASD